MAKYLIDANLPYYFSLWNTPDFIHQRDLDDTWTDEQIWQYAKDNNLTIITKDGDFSLKAIYKGAPPKVVHLRFGNLKMNAFHTIIAAYWNNIELYLMEYNLVSVYTDRVECVK